MTATGESEFSLEVSQNRYLSVNDRELHAVLAVTASGARDRTDDGADDGAGGGDGDGHGGAGRSGRPLAAEVILVDCSGSMGAPPSKIAAARRATAAAIDVLPDGARFAIVEGTHRARMIYPGEAVMAVANDRTRAEARSAAARLVAAGGTAMGSWLTQARTLLAGYPSAVRHALLLTDGHNHETPGELDRVLAACAGQFTCDARGIGEGWQPRELIRIASALHGTADAVRQPAGLVEDFRAVMAGALARRVPDARLRLTTTPAARIRFFKQVYPTANDLTGHAVTVDERVVEFPIGSWGDETRDYHLCLDVERGSAPLGEDVRAARVDLVVAGRPQPGPAVVLAHWTDDPVASTRLDRRVAHYTEQAELSRAVVAGCDAYDAGDLRAAQAAWARAVALATASGNERVLERLLRLVDVIDAPSGLVRLKPDLPRIDRMLAETGSLYSTRSELDSRVPAPRPPVGPDRRCECGRVWPADAVYCEACSRPLDPTPSAPEPR